MSAVNQLPCVVTRGSYRAGVHPGGSMDRFGLTGALRLFTILLAAVATIGLPSASAQTHSLSSSGTPAKTLKPALSKSDTQLVLAWIAQQVSDSRQPYCYRQSYNQDSCTSTQSSQPVAATPNTPGNTGITESCKINGVPISVCGAGQVRSGALCYPACNANTTGVGPVCWGSCPAGYTDTGALCTKAADTKSITSQVANCPSGYTNMGATCYDARTVHSLGETSMSCPVGMTRSGGRCYTACASGYTNTGVSCYAGPITVAKTSYGRGAGYPLQCAPGQHNEAGLCYQSCKAGYGNAGSFCWQNCPAGKIACGAGCSDTTTTCVTDTTKMVLAPIMLAANIASLGAAGEAETAAQSTFKVVVAAAKETAKDASQTYSVVSTLQKSVDLWNTAFTTNFAAMTTPSVLTALQSNFRGDALLWIEEQYAMQYLNLMLQNVAETQAKNALSLLSSFDPTGITSVVSAFWQPKCDLPQPFPAVRVLY